MKEAVSGGRDAIRAVDYLTGDAFTLQPTAEGWWRTIPAPKDMGPYYPAVYYGESERRFPAPVEWFQELLYRRRAGWVTKAARRTGRALDVGCGPGHLLARLRAMGWQAIGTEATEDSATIPRERYGLDVRTGELRTVQFASESFDAVVSWHTLEHMREPGEVLDECARILKTGGVLMLSVPDFSSPEAQAKPPAWFHLDVPRHLVHFPAAALRAELTRRGFIIEEESSFAPEYDSFSLTQTWQNRMGLPHNLLYLMLKSSELARGPRVGIGERWVAGFLAVPMLAAALGITLARAWSKKGAVIVLLARKA